MVFFNPNDGFWYADTDDTMPQTTFPATVRVISTCEVLTLKDDNHWRPTGRWSGVLPSGVKNMRDSIIQNSSFHNDNHIQKLIDAKLGDIVSLMEVL